MLISRISAFTVLLTSLTLAQAATPIPARYVLAAVDAHFQQTIAPAAVSYFPPSTTFAGDPGLAIVSARPDLRRGGVDLECRVTRDPQLPAFNIWVRHALPPPSAAAQLRAQPAPLLITPGHIASLSIQQGSMSLLTQVRPLQAAHRGQRVRAVSLATHAVIEVEPIAVNEVRLADR